MNEIRSGTMVLPDLQRDFVWTEDQIRLLLDSMLRGYPFGSVLAWNTQFLEVSYRDFVVDFRSGQTFTSKVKPVGAKLRMVLDGQQRLQSLYLAMFGTHDGRRLYFNVTSGPGGTAPDDDDEGEAGTGANYRFAFWNDNAPNMARRFVRVADIIAWPTVREDDEIDAVVAAIPLEGNDARVAKNNLRRLRRVVTDPSLVAVESIDDHVMNAAGARTIPEILEIFVRVNSGGTRLSRSDLMFSLIKSRDIGARRAFDSLVGDVDPGSALGIDKDFVIKGLLTVSDKPPAFDVENVERHYADMLAKFDDFSGALRATIDFCRDADVGLGASKLIQPLNTLFPIVYYLSRQHRCSVPVDQRAALRTVLYFLLFNSFVKSDARIRYLREVLQKRPGVAVPVDALLAVISARQTHFAIATTPELLARNIPLALNLAQPTAARDTLSWQAEPQIDHIFPQATYRPKHGGLVDDIGNLAYLGRLRNIHKSDDEPEAFFEKLSDDVLKADYCIDDRSLLRPDRFTDFVHRRRQALVDRVKIALGR